MLIHQLREATTDAHTELEKVNEPLIKKIKSKADYANFLKSYYGFYKAVQAKIDKHIDKTLITDYDERRRAAFILDDLKALGQDAKDIATAKKLPNIKNNATALGALYVLEGSTLGGKIITRMIGEQLKTTDKSLFKFFNGYGSLAATMWKAFTMDLNKLDEKENDAAIKAAVETFAAFKEHLQDYFKK